MTEEQIGNKFKFGELKMFRSWESKVMVTWMLKGLDRGEESRVTEGRTDWLVGEKVSIS